jgi:flagellin
MGMVVNTNIAAANAYRNLSNTQTNLNKSLEKLSSGLRINRAADDAAGLAISEGLRSQVNGLGVAANNAQDGINVVQTAEGGLNQTHAILQRLRDLAVQAGNDSNNSDSRAAIATEATGLVSELGRIGDSTNFNGTNLLDASAGSAKDGKLTFQVGANGDSSSQITVDLSGANVKAIAATLAGGNTGATATLYNISDVTALGGDKPSFTSTATDGTTTTVTVAANMAASYTSVDDYAADLKKDSGFAANFDVTVHHGANGEGDGIFVTAKNGGTVSAAALAAGVDTETPGTALTGGLKFDTAANAQLAIKTLDTQITAVSTARASLGASQNRLEYAVQTIGVAKENLTASESRIRDVDMADEMSKYTRSNILSQAGTAMLAQANQSTQGVLSLLR